MQTQIRLPHTFRLLVLGICLVLSVANSSFAQSASSGLTIEEGEITALIDLYQAHNEAEVNFSFSYGGETVTALLHAKHALIDQRHAEISGAVGQRRPDLEQVFTFGGRLLGKEHSDFLTLTISRKAQGGYWLSGFMRLNSEFHHIKLSARKLSAAVSEGSEPQALNLEIAKLPQRDTAQQFDACEVVSEPSLYTLAPSYLQSAAVVSRELEIATEADANFVAAFGDAVSANTRIAAILNAVDAIYQSQLGIALKITYQHTWESASVAGYPYSSTSASTLLKSVQSYWNANFANQRFDVAHLFSGEVVNSGTLGLAYVGAACSADSRYGMSFRYQADDDSIIIPTVAHEIGHNLGASHAASSPASLMSPAVTPNLTTFAPVSLDQISTFLISPDSSCITPIGAQNLDPPLVTLQPSDQTVIKGTQATFNVEVSGAGPFTYQWYKGKRKIKGAVSPSLSFVARSSSGRNPYKVQIKNAYGIVESNAVNLFAGTAPSVDPANISKSVVAGKKVTIAFKKIKGSKPRSYQWFRNGVLVEGQSESKLKFVTSASNNGEIYHLVISNPWGTIQTGQFTLAVTPAN